LSQARVRSTTQRRGKTTKPRTVSERFDDLDGPLADFVERGVELGAAVGAVGKDMSQPRMEISDRSQDQWGAIAILDVGFVDHSGDQQAVGVGEHVALTALDLLAGVVTARTGGLGGLD
jgi:hypothetical protein